jgi:rSAM/selenodomain-associated transferase 1
MIGKWTGTPLRTFLQRIGADLSAGCVGFECADGYYEGLDMATALHSRTWMAFQISDQTIPAKFGYPLRIRIPIKLGLKNPKFVATLYVTNQRPRGFWTDRGYNWFSGIWSMDVTCPSFSSCAIAVMAKAPRPGSSKTRLCPPLSPEQAARLSVGFHRDMFGNLAHAAWQAPIAGYAAYAPAGTEAAMKALMPRGMGLVLADGTPPMREDVRGFGRCLLHAIDRLFALGHVAACVLNSDSPTLPSAYLVRAARVLMEPADRIVLGPAEDGGYYLLGMRDVHASLFADIAWSTDTVAHATRCRAAELGLEVVELPVWYDVDDAASLLRLRLEIGAGVPGAYPAPATREALRGFGLAVLPATAE